MEISEQTLLTLLAKSGVDITALATELRSQGASSSDGMEQILKESNSIFAHVLSPSLPNSVEPHKRYTETMPVYFKSGVLADGKPKHINSSDFDDALHERYVEKCTDDDVTAEVPKPDDPSKEPTEEDIQKVLAERSAPDSAKTRGSRRKVATS